MNRLNKLWLCAIVIAGISGFAATTTRVSADALVIHIGANVAPTPTPVVYHYTYYPDQEAYYVPETHVYWWADHGTWVSGPRMPDGIVLGASVNLDVDAQEPWRHHDAIVKHYPHHKQDDKHSQDDKHDSGHDH
ncbi:MAG: hypothetical protein ABSA12_17055 [Verrucomicrobiia bacterium]|jgi:hypothetical protein